MATSCFWFSRLRCFCRFSSISSSFYRRSTSPSSCSRLTRLFNSPFRSVASSAAMRYLGASSSFICLCDSLSSILGRVSLYKERMTLSSLSSRGVDLEGDWLIYWVSLSMWAMMTLLSARRLRFCSFNSAFSCLQCRNYQFYPSSDCRNRPYSYYTFTRKARASSSRFPAITYHRCAAYNSFFTLPRSLSSTTMVLSDSDSRIAFFSQRASRNLVRCLMKRTASSLSQDEASLGGVERRESAVVAPGLPRARLPMILPQERLRFALQTDISWSISPSLRLFRSVIAKFYFDKAFRCTVKQERSVRSLLIPGIVFEQFTLPLLSGHLLVILGGLEGALLAVVVEDVVHEEHGEFAARMQVELPLLPLLLHHHYSPDRQCL